LDAELARETRQSTRKQAKNLKPIPEKEMPKWVGVASQAHKRATKKKRAELRRLDLPMIISKDGKVYEIPA
jgi:hypothetical protein